MSQAQARPIRRNEDAIMTESCMRGIIFALIAVLLAFLLDRELFAHGADPSFHSNTGHGESSRAAGAR